MGRSRLPSPMKLQFDKVLKLQVLNSSKRTGPVKASGFANRDAQSQSNRPPKRALGVRLQKQQPRPLRGLARATQPSRDRITLGPLFSLRLTGATLAPAHLLVFLNSKSPHALSGCQISLKDRLLTLPINNRSDVFVLDTIRQPVQFK